MVILVYVTSLFMQQLEGEDEDEDEEDSGSDEDVSKYDLLGDESDDEQEKKR